MTLDRFLLDEQIECILIKQKCIELHFESSDQSLPRLYSLHYTLSLWKIIQVM